VGPQALTARTDPPRPAGEQVWRSELTAIVINPKRQRGGGKSAAKEVRAGAAGDARVF
jgi:hypothetical protein